jgi:hypothetical protein
MRCWSGLAALAVVALTAGPGHGQKRDLDKLLSKDFQAALKKALDAQRTDPTSPDFKAADAVFVLNEAALARISYDPNTGVLTWKVPLKAGFAVQAVPAARKSLQAMVREVVVGAGLVTGKQIDEGSFKVSVSAEEAAPTEKKVVPQVPPEDKGPPGPAGPPVPGRIVVPAPRPYYYVPYHSYSLVRAGCSSYFYPVMGYYTVAYSPPVRMGEVAVDPYALPAIASVIRREAPGPAVALDVAVMAELRPSVRRPLRVGDPDTLFWTGYRLYWEHRYPEALDYLDAAVALRANDARYWSFKALAERALGEAVAAAESVRKAAALRRQNLPRLDVLGAALERVQGPDRRFLNAVPD